VAIKPLKSLYSKKWSQTVTNREHSFRLEQGHEQFENLRVTQERVPELQAAFHQHLNST
jgi:hypothetical protein